MNGRTGGGSDAMTALGWRGRSCGKKSSGQPSREERESTTQAISRSEGSMEGY